MFPESYKKLLDIERVKRKTPNLNKLKVTLKNHPIKGGALYAIKPIKKGELIAYYKIRLFRLDEYDSPTNNMYTFDVYTKSGNSSRKLIGDIDLTSFPDPINNIPFWAPFANEPMKNQKCNAEIDHNVKENYKNRKIAKAGSVLIYKLVATRNIARNDEITWYYGDNYERDYEVFPEDSDCL